MYGWNINAATLPHMTCAASVLRPVADAAASGGVMSGALIATARGWRSIETLRVGDLVHTFDNGLQPVIDIRSRMAERQYNAVDTRAWPIRVPAGTLGNAREMILQPDQSVMVESENACDAVGDPFAVVPVEILEDLCGITRRAPEEHTVLYTLVFAGEEVVYADGGILLYFPKDADLDWDPAEPYAGRYDIRTLEEARDMMTDLDFAEMLLDDSGNDIYGQIQQRVA